MNSHIHLVSLLRRSPWGGCEELWSKTALSLHSKGIKVSVSVCWWPEDKRHPRIAELEKAGIEVRYWGGKYQYFISTFINLFNAAKRKLKFGSPTNDIDYKIPDCDLVVFSHGGNDFPMPPIDECIKRDLKYTLLAHSVSESSWPHDRDIKNWHRAYNQADTAYFVSNANKLSTTYQLGFDDPKFKIVINPFNVPWETPFKRVDKSNTHHWAFVGRLEPGHKGVDLLIRAFAKEQWKTRNVHINFYGTGFSENSTKAMAKMLGLNDRVTFHGQVANLEDIWSKNELLVLASRHEGLPLVVTEAMLYGRPCLVTDVSGNPEQLKEGITGYIAAGPATNAVNEAMERAWANRESHAQMGEAAYKGIRLRLPRDPAAKFADELIDAATKVVT